MKVCIVGTGSQGTGLAGLLSMEEDVERLIIADYSEKNLETAIKLIETLGERKKVKDIRMQKVNAGNTQDVASVIRGSDVVFNGIIPRFNLPIMRACIQERCHYLDLFASPYESEGISKDETIGAQFELDKEFKKIGKTALPSIGISPGWTSLAAEYMMDAMDEVEDVIIRWADYLDSDEFLAAISPITLFEEWFGSPSPLRNVNGSAEQVDLLSSEEEFEFPEPIGKRKIYTVTAHPDIVLIPKYSRKKVHVCEEKGGVFLGSMTVKDMWIKAIQQATSKQGDEKSKINMMEEFSKAFVSPMEYDRLLKEGKIRNHTVCFSCEVTGWKDGGRISHVCYNTATLEESRKHLPWASPAVYGTVGGMPIELILALGRGEIEKTGVWSIGNLGIAEKLNKAMVQRGQFLTEKIVRTIA